MKRMTGKNHSTIATLMSICTPLGPVNPHHNQMIDIHRKSK